MRRLSIRRLMAFVLVSAVGLAALRNANALWSGMLLLLALAAVGTAVLGATLTTGRQRAWWLGFVVFEGGYLVAALCPVQSELATTHLFEYVHARVVGSEIATFEVSRLDGSSVLYRAVTSDGGVAAKTITNSVYEFNSCLGPPRLDSARQPLALGISRSRESRSVSARRPLPLRLPGGPGGRDRCRVVRREARSGR